MCFAPQRRAIFRHLQKWSVPVSFFTFSLANVLRATAACDFLQKLVRPCGVLCILTYKCASRHSGVPYLNIRTSKIGPTVRCFVHFDFKMCFAPQRRAIFEHQNVQIGPTVRCFVHLDFKMCCHFSSVCGTATSAPAALARLLFRALGTTNH